MSDRCLIDIQADIVDRLLGDDFFATIPVFTSETGNLESEINSSLGLSSGRGGKAGALVLVQQPIGVDEMPGVTFGAMDLEFNILVLEDPKVNRDENIGTLHPALEIVRRIIRVLKMAHLGGGNDGGAARLLRIGSPAFNPYAVVIGNDDIGFVVPIAYQIKLFCAEADSDVYTKVSRPTISSTASTVPSTVTLAVPTSGAAIYFSLDGSYPRPGGSGSVLYASPINLVAACTLRSAAYKTGSIPSDVVAADYTE